MKILIIHQYFNTPESGGPLRSYYLASGLSAHGHEVEVITAHNSEPHVSREVNGFKVHYIPVYYDNSMGFAKRVFAFAKFAHMAYKKALKLKQPDLCYAISTPLTVGWVAQKLKQKRNIPYLFEVGDLWPEAPIQMGVIRSKRLIAYLRKFERSIYESADKIIALSPGIKTAILKVAPTVHAHVIPNMSDCNYFQATQKSPETVSKYGLSGKLVVTYFGAAGRANHLEFLLDAAEYAMQHDSNLHFLVVAQGSELTRIKKLAKRMDLNNLEFLPYRNRDGLKEILNITDAVYVSYADVPVLATGSPNKYFDGLASGKIMLINFKGWLKNITEQHQLGYFVDPFKPEMVTKVCGPLVTNKEKLDQTQQNARLIAEAFFSRGLAIQKLLRVLHEEPEPAFKAPEAYTLTA